MENVQVQAPQAPARAQRRREVVTADDQFEAYRYKDVPRVGLPLPKKVPKIEAKQFPFDKNRDETGSDLRNLLKRSIFQVEDLIGDTRRVIYGHLPMNKKNKKEIRDLESQLRDLTCKLRQKIRELQERVGITLEIPAHFKKLPELED